jgi:hypothetical protein
MAGKTAATYESDLFKESADTAAHGWQHFRSEGHRRTRSERTGALAVGDINTMNQHRNITMQQLHKEEAALLRQLTEIRKAIEILEGDSQTPARLCPASRADLLKECLLKHPDGVGVDAGDATDSPADQATQVGMEKPCKRRSLARRRGRGPSTLFL